MYTLNNTPVFTDDVIYGVDLESSSLTAVDPADGRRIWATQEPVLDPKVLSETKRTLRHGTAFLIRLGNTNTYYIFSENGDLIFAELTVEGYKELGRDNVLEPTNFTGDRKVVWSHPAFSEKTMFARNDKKLVAVDLNESNY
jgi:outer membrane protein assembly factor BamB